jgi:hypothetical protein
MPACIAATEIHVARFGIDDMAEHHMADPLGGNPGPVKGGAGGNGGQLNGRNGGKGATEGADRRAGGGQDHDLTGIGHGQAPSSGAA